MQLGDQLEAKGITLENIEPVPETPAGTGEALPVPDPFNGEDEDAYNALCQQRIDDEMARKAISRQRNKEAYNFYEANEYDLKGLGSDDTKLYFKHAKLLVTEIIGALTDNGFEVKVKADPPPNIQDPEYLQKTAEYAQRFGLPVEDNGAAVSELLTHGENTINERQHLPILLQKWVESALVDADGAAYSYTGVSLFSPDVVVKERVPSDQIWLDGNAPDFYSSEWVCRFWPITLDKLKARWPQHAAYFDEHKNAGQLQAADDKDKTSIFRPDFAQDHWFRNWEMVVDEFGAQKPKYPGHWVQVWRYGNKVLEIKANDNLHLDCPYDQLLGVTRQESPVGCSFVLDMLYGPAMVENRAINAAIETAETIGIGRQLLSADALENPEDARNRQISTLLVRPGFNLQECVYNLMGSDISPSVKTILDITASKFAQITGAPGVPGAPNEAGDATKAGRQQAPFRARIRDFLARIAKKSVSNLIQYDDKERAFQTMGGFGPSIARYRPQMFLPIIENLEAYFTIEVTDKKQSVTDPVKQAQITETMIALAQKKVETQGGSYSKALESGPDFEGKDRMVRLARIEEAERKRQADEAKAKGLPDPTQQAIQTKNQIARGDAAVEVAKKNLQDWSKDNHAAVSILLLTGAADKILKIAQGEMPPLTQEEAEQVLVDLGNAAALTEPQIATWGATAPLPTVAPQTQPLPMQQGMTV